MSKLKFFTTTSVIALSLASFNGASATDIVDGDGDFSGKVSKLSSGHRSIRISGKVFSLEGTELLDEAESKQQLSNRELDSLLEEFNKINEVDRLERDNAENTLEITSLKGQLKAAEDAKEEAEKKATAAADESVLGAQIQTMQLVLEEAEDAKEEAVDKAATDKRALDDKITDLRKQLSAAEAKANEPADASALTDKIEELKKQVTAAEAKANEPADTSALTGEIADLKQQLTAAGNSTRRLELSAAAKKRALNDQIASLREDLESSNSAKDKATGVAQTIYASWQIGITEIADLKLKLEAFEAADATRASSPAASRPSGSLTRSSRPSSRSSSTRSLTSSSSRTS